MKSQTNATLKIWVACLLICAAANTFAWYALYRDSAKMKRNFETLTTEQIAADRDAARLFGYEGHYDFAMRYYDEVRSIKGWGLSVPKMHGWIAGWRKIRD